MISGITVIVAARRWCTTAKSTEYAKIGGYHGNENKENSLEIQSTDSMFFAAIFVFASEI